jgi:hypothetical protein
MKKLLVVEFFVSSKLLLDFSLVLLIGFFLFVE